MSLKSRLITFVICLLTVSIVLISLLLGWTGRQGTARQTETDGLVIARLLARGAGVLDKVPEDVEHLIGKQMVIQATFAAHLVAEAEGCGRPQEEILGRLKDVISKTSLSEVTITDSNGFAYLQTSPTSLPLVFQPHSQGDRRDWEFYPLLTGQAKEVIQEGHIREYDEKLFKYVGVAGVDKPRIVQVGYDLSFLHNLRQRVGFQRLVEGLLASGSVTAIWILNQNLETLAYGAEKNSAVITPTELELDYLERVVKDNLIFSLFHNGLLKVMAPIIGKDNTITGATIIHLPTEQLNQTLNRQVMLAIITAVAAILVGWIVTYILAKWLAQPVTVITKAAEGIEHGDFNRRDLEEIIVREDELGRLARVFSQMATQVFNREERLDALVRVRTRELEGKTRAVEQALDDLKKTQDQLVAKEKLASLGQLTSGIAHELKNPLNFVINFSTVTVDITKELTEELEKLKADLEEKDWKYLQEVAQDISQNMQRIHEHGSHAESIINSMIQHARSDSSVRKKVDFVKLVEESINLFYHSIKGKIPDFNFSIIKEFEDNIGELEVVPQEIERFIHYLLDNAHYAIMEKSQKLMDQKNLSYEPQITVTLKQEPTVIELRIRDNGTGIPAAIQDKIFNPFFTTKPTRRGNTGMGLSLAYDIVVQQHQGQITLISQEEEFTEFVIKLPKSD